jgi:hypothetical protein
MDKVIIRSATSWTAERENPNINSALRIKPASINAAPYLSLINQRFLFLRVFQNSS